MSVNPNDPAGVEEVVVTVNKIVLPCVPLGVKPALVVVPLVIVSEVDVKAHVTPVGVPLAQVRLIASAEGVPDPVSDNVTIYVIEDVPVP